MLGVHCSIALQGQPPLLHLHHSSFFNPSFASPTSQALHLIHLASRAHSPTFPSLHLRHNSFSNPSVASPTSQFILQTLFCFSYVTSSSHNSPGKPPMLWASLKKFSSSEHKERNGIRRRWGGKLYARPTLLPAKSRQGYSFYRRLIGTQDQPGYKEVKNSYSNYYGNVIKKWLQSTLGLCNYYYYVNFPKPLPLIQK